MGKNRYIKHARISERKFKEILKAFEADLIAQDTSTLTNVSRNTINKIFNRVRVIMLLLRNEKSAFSGEVELDESYFGAKRI